MKINKYWILAIIGLFVIASGTIMINNLNNNSPKVTKANNSKKETDSEYAQKKFDEIKKVSKNSNVLVVLYEPGEKYTDTFLNMVKTAEGNINYPAKPKVIYFKGDSFVKNWIDQGYAANSGTENNSKNIVKTNILTLKKGDKLTNLIGAFSEGRSSSDNSADKNGGETINAPVGAFALHNNEYIDDNVKYNQSTLDEIMTNKQTKDTIQEHVVNFAFSWFNDELFHRN